MYTRYVESQLNLQVPENYQIRHFLGKGWCPARRHIDMCEKAINWGADLICITGADQEHPEDMLCRLVDRFNEGYEVISALVPARGYVGWQDMKPFQRMAWRFKKRPTGSMVDCNALTAENPDVAVVNPEDGEVQEINFIGSGVIMFHRDHLLALKRPWFSETFNPQTMERLASMDTMFVWRLQTEAGARVFVDTTIDVHHDHIFPIDKTYSERFMDWTTLGVGDPNICIFPKETGQ